MSEAETKRILVVSGDYGVVQQARKALLNNGFAIQTAYSHRDSLYSLENGAFDAVLVDSLMYDQRSGEMTASALAKVRGNVPVIALTPNGDFPPNVISAATNETAILRSLSSVLHIPLLQPGESGAPSGGQRDEEVEALFDLSKSLTEVLELSEVLNRVVEAARRLTSAEEGMILLPDDDGGQLYLRAKVGIDIDVARNFRVKTEDTLAGRVYASGQPVLIGAQGPQKVKTEYLVNALLYVPILYEGKCIGVLGVNNKNTEAVFHPRHQNLLMNLASFAAIAIENARIHEETVERTRELQTLIDASNVLNSSLDLDETLPNICEQLMRVLNVNLSEIYRWDRESNQLRTLARCFRTIWPAGQGPILNFANWPSIRSVIETKRPIGITRASAVPSEAQNLDQLGVGAVQIIPIFGGEQALGTLQVYYIRTPQKLPDEGVLQRVQNMTLELLVALSNQTDQSRIQGVFRVVDEIIRVTKGDWCELALFTPDQQSLSVNLATGQGIWVSPPQPYYDLAHYPDIMEAVQTQLLIHKQSDSKMMTPGIRALLDKSNSRAILCLPLIQRGQIQGMVLFADTRRSRVFSQRDIDMGRALVGQAATALENAGLVHDLEQSLRDLRDTQDRLVQTARLSAMGELAAAVAHQINNPLTTIMVDSEMMLLDEQVGSQNYRSLQAINRAGKRAAGVARRLLAIARPNDPESPPERIDVADTIEGVLSLVKSHIERDRIQVTAELPAEKMPPVWAVPGQLDDIWLNLLLNAHDALIGRDGARMGIKAAYKADENIIEVIAWDNGPGIPEKIIADVFKPFFTTKPVGEGTGLGLHICRQTAERIGGSIDVKSVPNVGTQFFVRLPVRGGA
jgi:signal transduction histidine kinase